jgi:hypothetical protein
MVGWSKLVGVERIKRKELRGWLHNGSPGTGFWMVGISKYCGALMEGMGSRIGRDSLE